MADYMLRPDPMFQSLRGNTRFVELLDRMVERGELQNEVTAAGALVGYDEMIAAGPLQP